jgi:hypothetical protein
LVDGIAFKLLLLVEVLELGVERAIVVVVAVVVADEEEEAAPGTMFAAVAACLAEDAFPLTKNS